MRKKKYRYIIAVDAGSSTSGIAVLMAGNIREAKEDVANGNDVLSFIMEYTGRKADVNGNTIVLIEDIRPYSVTLGHSTLETIKYIGELRYCLKQLGIDCMEVPRSQVKEWVKLQYGYVVNKLLDKKVEYRSKMNDRLVEEGKIEKNNLVKKDGDLKAATYVWIDDRMVAAAMRVQWNIEKPKVGQKAAYGLKTHSWQALALATYYLKTY